MMPCGYADDFHRHHPGVGQTRRPIWFGAVLLKKSALSITSCRSTSKLGSQATVSARDFAAQAGQNLLNFQRPDAPCSPSSMNSRSAGPSVL